MTFFGIDLRRPSFNEITAATVMAVGLWVGCIGLARALGQALDAKDAGALLVVAVWACIGTRFAPRSARAAATWPPTSASAPCCSRSTRARSFSPPDARASEGRRSGPRRGLIRTV